MRRIALILALLWLVNVSAAAARQSTPQSLPTFEVATIKPQTDPRPPRAVSPPDRFIDPNATLLRLVEFGYELTQAKIAGGPEWMATRRFAIDAKAAGTPSRAEMRVLVRTLLAQRFNLKTHTETRELPVYLLERVRPNGPLGRALRVTPTSECAAPAVSVGAPRDPDSPPPCGVISASPVRISARGVAMSQFAM